MKKLLQSFTIPTNMALSSINPFAVVQKVELEVNAEYFRIPFSMSISGPSQSKKK
jgi:hypothetical protein